MRTATTLIAALLLVSCTSAQPTDSPEVERMGKWVLRYQGPEIEAVVGYRFATTSIGDDWLMLDVALTGASGQSIEIERNRVFVRTPNDEAVYLATQERFGEAYSRLQPKITRAAIAADPLDYWSGRSECATDFLVAPGSRIAQLAAWVNDRRVCQGRLFFELPNGVQPGHYVLGIDLEESKVRIPFELREE